MSDFKPAYPDTINLDPDKRVYYSHGLVLGVDEFVQEELYLLEKNRRHNRGLHGYGTVCGLALDWRVRDAQPELLVGPGIALDPQGREVRVPEAQCARLNDWLLRHRDEVAARIGSPPGSPPRLALHLVLCYDECTTDAVPVPSGPCQSLDRTSVPSRVADNFRLELRTDLATPEQVEEQAVKDFIDLLRSIPVVDTPGGLDHDGMVALVRTLVPTGSPPAASPPAAGHMHPDDVGALTRTAFRTWVTAVRPALLPSGRNCARGPGAEGCILLGRVEFDVDDTDAGPRVDGDVAIDDSERPYLLHTRLLQEHLASCCAGGAGSSGGGGGADTMHLSGAETVTGIKTFAAPLRLAAAGRVRKRIELPAGLAAMTYPATTRFVTSRSVPAVQFRASGGPLDYQGTAIFDLRLPDDLDPADPLRLRLMWFFDVAPSSPPPASFDYRWEIRTRYFAADENLPQTLAAVTPVEISGIAALGREFDLLVSDFTALAVLPGATSRLGALHIKVAEFDPPIASVFLVKAEVEYTANRLGRAMP